MKHRLGLALMVFAAGNALAQDDGFSVSAGVRAWYTHWTTFSYYAPQGTNLALTQVSAAAKWVPLPTLSLRYGNFFGSLSAFPSTGFDFTDGSSSPRQELDLNLGYTAMPGVNLTLGYKKITQGSGQLRYEPAGPVAGVAVNAPLAGAYSVYGALGLGRLKTAAGAAVDFRSEYRLTEIGLAYSIATGGGFINRWTLTAGHRVQVLRSKEAFGNQDGIDTTQGFTLGALASF